MVRVVCLFLSRMGIFISIIRSGGGIIRSGGGGGGNGLRRVMQLTEPHILLLLMKLIGRDMDKRWS